MKELVCRIRDRRTRQHFEIPEARPSRLDSRHTRSTPATAIAAPVRQASQAVRSCVKGNERTCRWMRNRRNRNSAIITPLTRKHAAALAKPRVAGGRAVRRRVETLVVAVLATTNRRRFLRMGPRLRESLASPKESSARRRAGAPWAVPSAIPRRRASGTTGALAVERSSMSSHV